MAIKIRIQKIAKWCIIAFFPMALIGCPRIAYISLYNNTGVDLRASGNGGTPDHLVVSKGVIRFGLTARYVQVQSELGEWTYERNIPLGGKDGPHFDGTLRLQINSDGRIYALKGDELPPLVEFPTQPTGYPLMPTSGSSPTP